MCRRAEGFYLRAGVQCGRPAVFGEGWGGEGRVRLVGGHARDGLARPEACAPRRAPRTPIGRARYRGYDRKGCTPPGPTVAARPHATRELQDPPAARTASPHGVRDVRGRARPAACEGTSFRGRPRCRPRPASLNPGTTLRSDGAVAVSVRLYWYAGLSGFAA